MKKEWERARMCLHRRSRGVGRVGCRVGRVWGGLNHDGSVTFDEILDADSHLREEGEEGDEEMGERGRRDACIGLG